MRDQPVRGRRLEPSERRAELLAAGEKLFSERAFDDVSLDDLADEAGISKNLLYHYFAGKRELYIEMVRDATARMVAATAPDASLEPAEQLHASIDAHLNYAREHAQGYIALQRGAGVDAEVQAIVLEARERVVARALAALPFPDGAPAEVELALHAWVGTIDSLTIRWLEHPGLPQERVRDLLAEIFVAQVSAAATLAQRGTTA